MRLVFFGSGEFAVPTLRALAEAHEVGLVVTQPDRPAGRRRKLSPTPVAEEAERLGIETIKPEKCNTAEVRDRVERARPEANVVAAFGQFIGRKLIESPAHGAAGTMNLHASLLPKYRGAAPIHWALLNGETETGNTVFQLVERMDAGDILGRQRTPIDPRETAGELHDRLAAMGPELVLDMLGRLNRGTLQPEPQDEARATQAPKLTRADAAIRFDVPADQVRRTVHGLTPWPGISSTWVDEASGRSQRLLLRRVEPMPDHSHGAIPGELLAEDGLVATSPGAVRLLEVQPPGKRTMRWAQYAHGHQVSPGVRFLSTEEAAE